MVTGGIVPLKKLGGVESCTGMGMTGLIRGNPAGMEAKCAGFPRVWKKSDGIPAGFKVNFTAMILHGKKPLKQLFSDGIAINEESSTRSII